MLVLKADAGVDKKKKTLRIGGDLDLVQLQITSFSWRFFFKKGGYSGSNRRKNRNCSLDSLCDGSGSGSGLRKF